MPSIMCRCGTRLRYGEIPNPIEWLAISDTNYDQFTNTVEAEQPHTLSEHRYSHAAQDTDLLDPLGITFEAINDSLQLDALLDVNLA